MTLPKLDLETLLQLKRCERPNEAFWDAFDARLHQRLSEEVAPRSSNKWLAFVYRLQRLLPIPVGCGIAAGLLCSVVWLPSVEQLMPCSQPMALQECQYSVARLHSIDGGVPFSMVQKNEKTPSLIAADFSF
jgi:hypothetical protein